MSGKSGMKFDENICFETINKKWKQDVKNIKSYCEDNDLNFKQMIKNDSELMIGKIKETTAYKYLCSKMAKTIDSNYVLVFKNEIKVLNQSGSNFATKMIPKELLNVFIKNNFDLYSETQNPKQQYIFNHEEKTYNTFPLLPFDIEEISEYTAFDDTDVKLLIKYFTKVLCDEKTDTMEYWVHMVKYLIEGKRTKTVPYLYGEKRQGKSTWIEIIRYFVGNKRCNDPSVDAWAAQFTGFLENKQCVFTQETLDSGSGNSLLQMQYTQATNRIKTISTDDSFPLRKMGKDLVSGKNHSNVFFTSNSLLPSSDLDDDRYKVFCISNKYLDENGDTKFKLTHEEFARINLEILNNDKVMKTFLNWILNKKVEPCCNLQKFKIEACDTIRKSLKISTTKISHQVLGKMIQQKVITEGSKYKCSEIHNHVQTESKTKVRPVIIKQDLISVGVQPCAAKGIDYYKFLNIEKIIANLKENGLEFDIQESGKNDETDSIDEIFEDMSETKELKATIKTQQQTIDKQMEEIEKLKEMIQELQDQKSKPEKETKPKKLKKKEIEKPKAKKPKLPQEQILNEINTLLGSDSDSE